MTELRLLLIRLGLRRPTLGDALARLMRHRRMNDQANRPLPATEAK